MGITSREWPGSTQLDCGEGGVYTIPTAYRAFIEAEIGFALPTASGSPPSGGETVRSDGGFTTIDDSGDSGAGGASTANASGAMTTPVVTDSGRGGCSLGGTGSLASLGSLLLWALFMIRRR